MHWDFLTSIQEEQFCLVLKSHQWQPANLECAYNKDILKSGFHTSNEYIASKNEGESSLVIRTKASTMCLIPMLHHEAGLSAQVEGTI